MKKLKALLLIALFVSTAITTNAQIDLVSHPKVGKIISLNPYLFHDMGKVKLKAISHTFKIKNTGDLVIDIVDIDFPPMIMTSFEGFHINPGEEGSFTVTVDPEILGKGSFMIVGIISTEEKDSGGNTKTGKIQFLMTGEVL